MTGSSGGSGTPWVTSRSHELLMTIRFLSEGLSLGDSAGQLALRGRGFDWIVEVLREAYLKHVKERRKRGATKGHREHFSLTFTELRDLYSAKYDLLELKPSEFGAADSSDLLQRLSKHNIVLVVYRKKAACLKFHVDNSVR